MRSFLFAVSLVVSLSLAGQDYKPLVIEGNSWAYAWWSWGWAITEYQFINGDTTINNLVYNRLYNADDSLLQTNIYYVGAIREDIAQKEVYYLDADIPGEKLLYKFGLNQGDTVVLATVWINPCEIESTISMIDTVIDENGIERRRMHINTFSEEYWIEGVGSTWGLLTPGHYFCIADLGWEMLCLKNQGQRVYVNPSQGTCYLHEVGTKELSGANFEVSIIPNPVTNRSKIILPDNSQINSIMVFDHFGRLIVEPDILSPVIDRDDFKPGIYILRILTTGGKQFSTLFMVD